MRLNENSTILGLFRRNVQFMDLIRLEFNSGKTSFGERESPFTKVQRRIHDYGESAGQISEQMLVMFSYAERRRVIDSNPVLRTAQPKLVDKPMVQGTAPTAPGRDHAHTDILNLKY